MLEMPLSTRRLSDPNSVAASCDVPAVPADLKSWPAHSPCKVKLQSPDRHGSAV